VTSRPEIAVVVPTFNRVDLVQRAVRSVLVQSLPPQEIVVVDDGSTDETAGTLRGQYPDIRVVSQENAGPGAARNRGVRETRSVWIAFLDSDDEWAASKLGRQSAVLEETGRLVCHTSAARDGGAGDGEVHGTERPGGVSVYQQCVAGNAILTSTVVLHRSVLDEVGGFDESVPACEDYGLWLRIAARYPVAFVDESLATIHVGHRDRLSSSFWGLDRFRIPSLEAAWRTLDLPPEERIVTLTALIDKLGGIVEGARERRRTDLLDELEHRVPHYERLLLLERIGQALEW
jgi:glycosyltransferase involved in cell wall biosynthesis